MNEIQKATAALAVLGILAQTQTVPASDCFRSPMQSRIGARNPPKAISADERDKRRKRKKAAEASKKRNRK